MLNPVANPLCWILTLPPAAANLKQLRRNITIARACATQFSRTREKIASRIEDYAKREKVNCKQHTMAQRKI